MLRVSHFLSLASVSSVLAPTLLVSLSGPVAAQITGQPTLRQSGQPATGQPVHASPANGSVAPAQPVAQPAAPQPLLPAVPNADSSNPLGASSASNSSYILGAGDQISLSVIGYPEFTGTLVLLSDGTVTLPLTGRVRAAGMTASQLSEVLTTQLRAYLVDPVVSVGLVAMRPVIVTVSGEVHRPGPIQLSSLSSSSTNPLGTGGTDALIAGQQSASPTLSSAVILAGGVTRDADIRQVIVRRPVVGGQIETLSLNLWDAITSDAGAADIGLRDGDSIFIPRLSGDEIDRRTVATSSLAPSTIRVKVVGEVVSPGEIQVPPDSSISSAVAIAGGPTTDAQLSSVSLVRKNETGGIEQEEVDLSNLVDDYQVQDGDVVVVAKRGYLSVIDGVGRVLNPLNIFRLFGL
ncbi:MAG: polysaccharide biosynthesis/export family protein [Cyanobacteria bacterium P01_F01_bin.53]